MLTKSQNKEHKKINKVIYSAAGKKKYSKNALE